MEYYIQFWLLHYRKHEEALEGVHKRFMRLLPGLLGISYKKRMDKFGLFSPKCQKLRDLTKLFEA